MQFVSLSHPHFWFWGGPPAVLLPWGEKLGVPSQPPRDTHVVPMGGQPKVPFSSCTPRGVTDERGGPALAGGWQMKGGPCPCPTVLGTPPHAPPLLPCLSSPSLGSYSTSRHAAGGSGGSWLVQACREDWGGGVLAPPGMWGCVSFGVLQHLQACRGDVGGLLAPPDVLGRGLGGCPWYLHACCRDLGVGSWHLQTCWQGSPKGFWHLQALGGAPGTSRHVGGAWAGGCASGISRCSGTSLGLPSISRHLPMFWGHPAPPDVLEISRGSWPPFCRRGDPQLGVPHFLRSNSRP